MYGLGTRWVSTRSAHDREPSITYDPLCDAWIDRQVRPHFRLFGLHLPPSLSHMRSPSVKLGFLDPALQSRGTILF